MKYEEKKSQIILTRKRRKGRLVIVLRRLPLQLPILITITSSQWFGVSQ